MEPSKVFFIADDDPDDRELFIEALHGIDQLSKCITAFDGQEAFQTYKWNSSVTRFYFFGSEYAPYEWQRMSY